MSERVINDPTVAGWEFNSDTGYWMWGGSGGSIGGVLISDTEPTNKTNGMMWMDTSTAPAKIWIWDADKWIEMPFSGGGAPRDVREITGLEYLVIGGGGSGGTGDGYRGGGGGAGGYRTNVLGDTSGGNSAAEGAYPTIPIGAKLDVSIGAGGYSTGQYTFQSATSSFFDHGGVISKILSINGGAGGNNGSQGQLGGSSGGAFSFYGCATATGTAGQGCAGGGENIGYYGAGGGGGAESAGTDGGKSTDINGGGNGGNGLVSSIDGLNKSRAAGGGGGGSSYGGNGGSSSAGKGATSERADQDPIYSGEPNTGSGGGGSNSYAGSGGSGVVIVRYPGDQAADGGDITAHNGYTVHTFNTDGTFEVWS